MAAVDAERFLGRVLHAARVGGAFRAELVRRHVVEIRARIVAYVDVSVPARSCEVNSKGRVVHLNEPQFKIVASPLYLGRRRLDYRACTHAIIVARVLQNKQVLRGSFNALSVKRLSGWLNVDRDADDVEPYDRDDHAAYLDG